MNKHSQQGPSIFVFGSNTAGRHGAGAALAARRLHGAIYGQGTGLQGESYAIPTKNHEFRTLPLARIQEHVLRFLHFAEAHPEMRFHVTRIGCGLAGFTDSQIAPLFRSAPANCRLPQGWRALNHETEPETEAVPEPDREPQPFDELSMDR